MNARELRARLLLQLDDTTDAHEKATDIGIEYSDAKRAYDAATAACEQEIERLASTPDPRYSNATKRKYEAARLLDTRFPGIRENYEATSRRKYDADRLEELRMIALKTLRDACRLTAAELEVEAATASVTAMPRFATRRTN